MSGDVEGVLHPIPDSVEIHDRFLFDPDISDKAIRVLAVLKSYARHKAVAFPSRKTLGARLGCSEATIGRAIAELCKAHAITIEKVARRGGGWPIPHYWLWPWMPDQHCKNEISRPDNSELSQVDKNAHLTKSLKEEQRLKTTEPSGSKRVPAKPRSRNAAWDALISALEWDPEGLTRQAASRIGKAVREITEALPEDITPVEVGKHITARARRYRTGWPGSTLTPEALVKHWSEFGPKAHPAGSSLDPDQALILAQEAQHQANWALTDELVSQ